MNMITPGGQVVVVGTPFHEADLYADLKAKAGWKVFEYPAITPTGSLLWEERHNLDSLMEKKNTQGSIIFSREILVKPVTSESTIFPYELVSRSFKMMDEYTVVDNIYSHTKKFVRTVVGCDFAISGNVGADYSVFTTLGIDDLGNYWLLNVWREKGKTYSEQMAKLKQINSNFRPEVVMVETNQMQQIFAQMGRDANIPIVEHNTGTNKYNLERGVPGLVVLFEQEKFRFPRGDQRSMDITDTIAMELAAITWTDKGKLEGVGAHDDTAMSLWISVSAANYVGENFSFSFL